MDVLLSSCVGVFWVWEASVLLSSAGRGLLNAFGCRGRSEFDSIYCTCGKKGGVSIGRFGVAVRGVAGERKGAWMRRESYARLAVDALV